MLMGYFLCVFPLVLLEFIFLTRFLVFQIGFMEKLFTFKIQNLQFFQKIAKMSIILQQLAKGFKFFQVRKYVGYSQEALPANKSL